MRKSELVILLAAASAMSAFAQSGAGLGSISGLVQDASGSAVPDATVVVANESKGIRRNLATTSEGQFTAPALIPDAGYKVTVSKAGFANYEATNITLSVGQNVDLHILLSVASTTVTVDVTGTAAAVEDTKTDVSQLIDHRQIMELPTNGRRVDSFVLLSPGVAPDGAFGLLSFRGVAGHNSFLTDGNDTTNQFYNENAGRTRITSPISQEAVQEFQVISNNFAAEYGNAMGGVINTITKSGTNDLHGTAYWFFRNRSLNARDRYATFNPQDIRYQTGVSLAGHIIKDKLFYYANYEATRRDFPAINSFVGTGIFNSAGTLNLAANPCPATTATVVATAAQCQSAIDMILKRNFQTVSRKVTQDLGLAKLDYQMNERNSLSFSVNMLRWVSPHGIQATGIAFTNGAAIGNNADSTVRDGYGRAQWTSVISPAMVNEVRFGWFHDRLYDPASDDFLYPGLGRATLTVASTTNLGLANSYPRLNPSETRYEISDSLSWTKGAHTMKFGFSIAHTEDFVVQLINQYGSYNYSSLNNFALDFSGNTAGLKNWNTYSQTFGNPQVDTNLVNYGFYAQDQYRINPRLLVNYGVRYEYTSIPQPTIINPDYPQTGVINAPKNNWSPRTGFSYALTSDQKTLIRAGYGIFYARYQAGLIENLFLSNGVYQTAITYTSGQTPEQQAQLAAGPVYPNNLAATTFKPSAGSINILFADKNFRNPYTHQANIGIERQVTSTINLNVSYIWSRGVRLYGVRDLNVGPLGDPVTYNIQDVAGNTVGTYTTPTYRTPRPDLRYRQVSQLENPGLSYYDGLAVQLNKRFTRGFQGSVAYTWSHAIDLNQSTATNNIFFSPTPTSYTNGDFAAEKGSAANDVRHRFVVNFVLSPTFTKSTSFWARYLVNNWQLSGVTTLQSSQPINSTTNVSGNAFNSALASGSLNGLGGGFSRVPFQPVSNLDVDAIYKVDARLARKLPFTERVTGYLQIEAFNLFNTPYDTSRRGAEYDLTGTNLRLRADYATPSSTAASPDGTTSRRAQLSLRVTF